MALDNDRQDSQSVFSAYILFNVLFMPHCLNPICMGKVWTDWRGLDEQGKINVWKGFMQPRSCIWVQDYMSCLYLSLGPMHSLTNVKAHSERTDGSIKCILEGSESYLGSTWGSQGTGGNSICISLLQAYCTQSVNCWKKRSWHRCLASAEVKYWPKENACVFLKERNWAKEFILKINWILFPQNWYQQQ